ncbi:MAG TPA: aldehyde dehydrogenase family protein [Terriglobia bacterium]|nr:aldehyde dehydrogenase family protein [Terriglobia bacterium]
MDFIPVINPARFSEVVGQVPACSEADVDRALSQAQAAFKTWSRTTPEERASHLRAAARDLRNSQPELVRLFVRENGKPRREAQIDIDRSIELMEIVAGDLPEWSKPELIDKNQPVWARRRARGITTVISPWNSPVLLSFKRFLPAIAAGNAAVVKPASYCPLTLLQCIDIINGHLPAGVLRGVTGSGAVVGEKLASDERVRTIAFTGSTETGRRIMELASRTVKKVFLELGGNDPAIVLGDARLGDEAVARMTHAILRASGQVCIAIKRIYVHDSRLNELVEKLAQSFDRVIVGDGLAPETTMGPLNNKAQFQFVTGLIDKCRRKGLTVMTKGRKLSPADWNEGFFVLPSIVLGANEDDDLVRCEQFGPVIPIIPFANENDAIARANSTPYGLRASVWTEDRHNAEAIADQLEAGAVFLNNHGIFRDLHIEFPGIKQSGFSRESRAAALDHYADTYGFAE